MIKMIFIDAVGFDGIVAEYGGYCSFKSSCLGNPSFMFMTQIFAQHRKVAC